MSVSPPPLKRARLADPGVKDNERDRVITIYSWNVNGIDPLLQTSIGDFFAPRANSGKGSETPTSPASPLREFLRRHDWPTLCFLQEVKIASQDSSKLRQVKRAVSNSSATSQPDYEAHFCLPSKERYPNSSTKGVKVYGVCTLIRRDFVSAAVDIVRFVDWDIEGRILVVETKATGSMPKLAIINVYLVNGTELPYRDHMTGQVIGTRHDRKLQVHRLLQEECRQLEAQGFSVVIAGDINVARAPIDGFPRLRESPIQHVRNRKDFEERFFGAKSENAASDDDIDTPLGMFDTFRSLHPHKRGYSYYSRAVSFGQSCDRVDMILASQSLRGACVSAGMHEEPADRGPSDHVPIYAAFDFRRMASAAPCGPKPD